MTTQPTQTHLSGEDLQSLGYLLPSLIRVIFQPEGTVEVLSFLSSWFKVPGQQVVRKEEHDLLDGGGEREGVRERSGR